MFKPKLTALLIAAVAFSMATSSSLQAQETEAESAESAEAETANTPVGATLGAELLQQLASEEEEMAATIQNVTDRLATLGGDVENAEQIFDEMAAAIRRQAELGDPEGSFVQEVEGMIEQANALQVEARELGDTEVADEMVGVIAGLEAVREEAVALHADSFRALRQIESQKGRFVLRIRANLLSDAAEVAEEGVARLREFNGRINEIKNTIAPPDAGEAAAE